MSTPDDTDQTDAAELLTAVHELRRQLRGARREIRSLRDGMSQLSEQVQHAHHEHRRQFQQIEALASLYYALRPRHPLPQTRVWAASPDLLWYLYRTVRDHGLTRVLECGSGVSTLIVAYALQALGDGRVYALEHDETYVRSTRQLLQQHQLQAWAEVVHAPLRPVDLHGDTWPWYDLDAVPPQSFDLIFVDGPPGATRDHARFPAVPLLRDRLADGGIVILDDHSRPEEADIGRRWLEHYPELAAETLPHEKGTLLLRHVPQAAD